MHDFWKKISVFWAQKLHLAAVSGSVQKNASGSGIFSKFSETEEVQKKAFFSPQISEKDPSKKVPFLPSPYGPRFPTKNREKRRFGANFPVMESALFAKVAKSAKKSKKSIFSEISCFSVNFMSKMCLKTPFSDPPYGPFWSSRNGLFPTLGVPFLANQPIFQAHPHFSPLSWPGLARPTPPAQIPDLRPLSWIPGSGCQLSSVTVWTLFSWDLGSHDTISRAWWECRHGRAIARLLSKPRFWVKKNFGLTFFEKVPFLQKCQKTPKKFWDIRFDFTFWPFSTQKVHKGGSEKSLARYDFVFF